MKDFDLGNTFFRLSVFFREIHTGVLPNARFGLSFSLRTLYTSQCARLRQQSWSGHELPVRAGGAAREEQDSGPIWLCLVRGFRSPSSFCIVLVMQTHFTVAERLLYRKKELVPTAVMLA